MFEGVRAKIGRAVLVVLAMALPPSSGRGGFIVTDLGVLPGGTWSRGASINSSGQITGSAALDSFHQVAISGGGTSIRSIGTLPGGSTSEGAAISGNGLIAGSSDVVNRAADGTVTQSTHAFRTQADGSLEDLGVAIPGDVSSAAYGVNGGGHVAGVSFRADGSSRAVIGYGAYNFADLGDLGGGSAAAFGINGNDIATGWALTAGGAQHAFRGGKDGIVDIGSLPGFASSEGRAIALNGNVVGFAGPMGSARAFLARPGAPMISLGTLPFGSSSEAFGLNDAGIVVGQTDYSSGPSHAFVWDPASATMYDLNELISASSEILVVSATGINNTLQIVGTGLINNQLHAVILNPDMAPFHPIGQPVPEPGSWALLAIGGVALLARRRLRRGRKAAPAGGGPGDASPGR